MKPEQCDLCLKPFNDTDEVYEVPIYEQETPESEQIDTKHICRNCQESMETLAIGF